MQKYRNIVIRRTICNKFYSSLIVSFLYLLLISCFIFSVPISVQDLCNLNVTCRNNCQFHRRRYIGKITFWRGISSQWTLCISTETSRLRILKRPLGKYRTGIFRESVGVVLAILVTLVAPNNGRRRRRRTLYFVSQV